MKRLLWALMFFLSFGIFGFLNLDRISAKTNDFLYVSPCETPKPYTIGVIDAEFGLSKQEFTEAANEAASIWEKAYGKPVFQYNSDADLTIHAEFDARQELSTEINQLNSEVKQKDDSLQPKIDEYNRRSNELKARISSLNAEIRKWNESGGAPPDEYERMKNEQEQLQQETEALNALGDSLSLSTEALVHEAENLNKAVDTFNEALKFKPEGGIYTLDQRGERIVITIFDTRQELVHILAHEMGHALGIDHVEDENSIMFSKTNSVVSPTDEDLRALRIACRERNAIQLKFTELSLKLHQLLAQDK